MFRLLLLITVPLVLYFVIQAKAEGQLQPDEAQPGRYTMHQTQDGFLRMDTQTGEVSVCRRKLESWVCEGIADAAAAKDDEIARLTSENSRLREQVARLERGEKAEEPTGTIELPTKEDLDKVMGFFEDVMRRFNEMVKRMENQPEPDKQKI